MPNLNLGLNQMSDYWTKRNQEQAEKNATRLKELHEQGHVPVSLQEAFSATRRPVEARAERSTLNYALAMGLAPGDPLAKASLAKHFEK